MIRNSISGLNNTDNDLILTCLKLTKILTITKICENWTVGGVCVCSVTAHGASGGRGLYNALKSKAAYVSATFHLSIDDQLAVIVGQQGHAACYKVTYTCVVVVVVVIVG